MNLEYRNADRMIGRSGIGVMGERYFCNVIPDKRKNCDLQRACDVFQLEDFYSAIRYLNFYRRKIRKSSIIVRNTFTVVNFAKMHFKYRTIQNTIFKSGATRVKLPIYELLKEPCYLLMVLTSLKKKNTGGVDDIPVTNVTLAALLGLSRKLRDNKYKPSPSKRIFIPKRDGKVRPLGIANSLDKVVQQGLMFFLSPLFEKIFVDQSHGFRKGKSCHTALHSIFYR